MEIIKKQKRKFSSVYKARVALDALSGHFSIQELMEKFDLNRQQIVNWKEMLISKAYLVFEKEESENNNMTRKEPADFLNQNPGFTEKENLHK